MQQGLPELSEEIHKLGLGVISFTGRKYKMIKDILFGCDVVLDSDFSDEQPDNNG